MSTPDKRARENRKAQKKREKAQRRWERREQGPGDIPHTTAEEVMGDMRSIDEVMRELEGGSSGARAAASVPTKLFVGGLSYDTTNASLRAAFELHGEVLEASVVTERDTGQSRGFGFVTMSDRKDAPRAIKALDNSDLDGRNIVVNVATERGR